MELLRDAVVKFRDEIYPGPQEPTQVWLVMCVKTGDKCAGRGYPLFAVGARGEIGPGRRAPNFDYQYAMDFTRSFLDRRVSRS